MRPRAPDEAHALPSPCGGWGAGTRASGLVGGGGTLLIPVAPPRQDPGDHFHSCSSASSSPAAWRDGPQPLVTPHWWGREKPGL